MSRTAWATDTIAELGRGAGPIVQTGPFGSQLHAEDYVEDGVPFILIRNIGDGGLRPDNLPRISEADAKRLVRYSLKAGDIVFSRVGRIGSCLLATPNEEGWIISGQTLRLRLQNPDIDAQFLLNYLRSHAVQNFVSLASVGTTRESLNTKILLSIPIRYPVVEGEQRRIAEILGTVDETIEQTEALIAKQQQVKAGLMHDLFTRGLTPDGQLRPTRADAPDLYHETPNSWLPQGWDFPLLDAIAQRGSGHTPNRNRPEYWNGGIKWVSLADSWRLDQVYISETDKQISAEGIANSSAVLHPPGIVVLSRDAGVGKSAITTEEMAVSQHFMCWRCGSKLDKFYLYYWLQYRKRDFENIATGSTIPTIGLAYFKKYRLAVPTALEEQQKIGARLLALDESIAAEIAHLAKLRQLKHGLMQALLSPPGSQA